MQMLNFIFWTEIYQQNIYEKCEIHVLSNCTISILNLYEIVEKTWQCSRYTFI